MLTGEVVDQAALSVRIPGAAVVAAVAAVTTLISLVWAWRDRPTLILAAWAALLLSVAAGYFVIPGFVRASAGADGADCGRRSPPYAIRCTTWPSRSRSCGWATTRYETWARRRRSG